MREEELQEKIFAYRILEGRLNGLVKQRDLVASKIAEIQSTLVSIEEVEKSEGEILFPIGSEAYTPGKVVDKKNMIVEIGANVALEKTVGEAKETLNKRIVELENALREIQKEIMRISQVLEQLTPEIKSLVERSKAG